MLRLIRAGGTPCGDDITISAYRESSLLDIGFTCNQILQLKGRRLTKFRMIRKAGDLISLEVRGAVLTGLEMLVSKGFTFDGEVEVFSESLPSTRELPLLGVELDGTRSSIEISAGTIDQSVEFTTRFASTSREIEIAFDTFYTASRCGSISIFFNKNMQFSGVRASIPKDVEVFSKNTGSGLAS